MITSNGQRGTTIKLIFVAVIAFVAVLSFGSRSPDTLALLFVLLLAVVMWVVSLIPTTLRLTIVAGAGFALAFAGQSSVLLFGLGMGLALLALSLIPAPWLGYDDFCLYRWFEASDKNNEDGPEDGDGGDGD
jgi:hypothetical protein